MVQHLDRFVKMLKANGHQFVTFTEFFDDKLKGA